MKRLEFRTRLLLALSLFSLVPAAVVTIAWASFAWRALPAMSAGPAWDRVVSSGERALSAARQVGPEAAIVRALDEHERELQAAATQARRLDFVMQRLAPAVGVTALLALGILWMAASRVAGHLSRQLSRPLQELVGWTRTIQSGAPLPELAAARGAPEFEVLRSGMREMARELAEGRQRALESERLLAFRETARRVAHELKNPLTPMQFAIAQLRRSAPPESAESLRVLEEETARLHRMAASFSQFGTLPTGPSAPIDIEELVRTTTAACVPSHLATRLDLAPGIPRILGHHDTLQRALMNVLLNAVDACGNAGAIHVRAATEGQAVVLEITDSGPGIEPELLSRVFDPYVTRKANGTGLGLAIAQHAVHTHQGHIEAMSPPGHGATIRITLPITPPAKVPE